MIVSKVEKQPSLLVCHQTLGLNCEDDGDDNDDDDGNCDVDE